MILKQKDDPIFKRENNHLVIKRTITLGEALTGVRFMIDHLDDRVLDIRANKIVKPNELMKIEGEGMPKHGNPFEKGDLIVAFQIEFPDSLNEDQILIIKSVFVLPENVPEQENAEIVNLKSVQKNDSVPEEESNDQQHVGCRPS